MRIVSQLRGVSFNFDNIVLTVEDDLVVAKELKASWALGRYKDHGRALEVFEEIHKYFTGGLAILENTEIDESAMDVLRKRNIDCISVRGTSEPKIEAIGNFVFYMPEE